MLKTIETIADVMKLSETNSVVLVMTGDDCQPCTRLKDTLSGMDLDKYDHDICIVNISDSPNEARALGVRSVPTTVSLSQGKVTRAIFGEQSEDKLDTFLSNIL